MTRLDETNLRILHLLQANGRISVADLAASIGRSESTVRDRLVSLEMQGVVRGYEARIDWNAVGLPAQALVRGRADPARLQEVAQLLQSLPQVMGTFVLTGPKPILAILRVRDLAQLQELLSGPLTAAGLVETEAEIVLDALVPLRSPDILRACGAGLESQASMRFRDVAPSLAAVAQPALN